MDPSPDDSSSAVLATLPGPARAALEAACAALQDACTAPDGTARAESALGALGALQPALSPAQWAAALRAALTERYDPGGRTPLTAAAHAGAAATVARLLACAAQWGGGSAAAAALAGAPDANGWCAVHEAAFAGHADALRTLLGVAPALATRADRQGSTPLHCAAYAGSVPCAAALLDAAGALAEAQAQAQGTVDAQQLAAARQAGAERLAAARCAQGYTAMHYAALGGAAALVAWLAERCPCAADDTVCAVNGDGLAPADMAPGSDSAVAREIDAVAVSAQFTGMAL